MLGRLGVKRPKSQQVASQQFPGSNRYHEPNYLHPNKFMDQIVGTFEGKKSGKIPRICVPTILWIKSLGRLEGKRPKSQRVASQQFYGSNRWESGLPKLQRVQLAGDLICQIPTISGQVVGTKSLGRPERRRKTCIPTLRSQRFQGIVGTILLGCLRGEQASSTINMCR